MKTHVLRLHPGDDLRLCLERYVKEMHISASALLSCVGSLSSFRLRDATGIRLQQEEGDYEIVSATGTLSEDRLHVHASLSRSDLSVIGGHLADGCIIKTTAEIVLLELDNVRFGKVFDPTTGYNELDIIRT